MVVVPDVGAEVEPVIFEKRCARAWGRKRAEGVGCVAAAVAWVGHVWVELGLSCAVLCWNAVVLRGAGDVVVRSAIAKDMFAFLVCS